MNVSSLWENISSEKNPYHAISKNIEVDVAVIGGGITGITAALALVNAGKKVTILESNTIGGMTTSHSTGNLYIPVQPYYQTIAKHFDIKTAKQIAASRKLAIDYIEAHVKHYDIDCQFHRRPWYIYTNQQEKEQLLKQEIAILKKIDVAIDYTTNLPFNLPFNKAAVMPNQARFNPLQYVRTLAAALQNKGCLIFENTHVTAIDDNTTTCTLTTENAKTIVADKVFMATHTPLSINLTQMFTAAYRSYVVGAYLEDKTYPEAHLWQLDRTQNYILSTHALTKSHPEILLISGSHHKTGQNNNTQKHFLQLENFLESNFALSEIAFRWSAQHFQSADNIPYIGLANRHTKNIYMATGYFADGLIYGTLAGLLITDSILNKSSTYSKTYHANRATPLFALNFLAKENLNVLAQYMQDLPGKNTHNFADIAIGEGKIVTVNREKWAVSRDKSNDLHMVSAVCTHMKCIVNWNNAEQTWDCPCHGSRFTSSGEVLEGPATRNLRKKTLPKESN